MTMKRCMPMGLLVVAMIMLGACSSRYATNGETQYLKSRNGPSLVVPSPLTKEKISGFYFLPQQSNPNPAVKITPPSRL